MTNRCVEIKISGDLILIAGIPENSAIAEIERLRKVSMNAKIWFDPQEKVIVVENGNLLTIEIFLSRFYKLIKTYRHHGSGHSLTFQNPPFV